VQIRTVVKPGDDAAVLRVDDEKAFTLTSDCNSIHCFLNPYHGGAGAVAESIRNVVSMGSEPLCMVDCLNFGNPEKPEVFWQFSECVKGMADIAKKFQLPVTSGNVSFYNETEGVTVNPSPVVSVAGIMDIKDIRTMEFKNDGDKIILIGTTNPEMDGSEYHKTIHGLVQGEAPKVNIKQEYASAQAVLGIIHADKNELITAVHDISAGGLGVALSEMTIKGDIGASVDLSSVPGSEGLSASETLFSESHARYLITVTEEASTEILSILKEKSVPAAVIGTVGGASLKMFGDENQVEISVSELNNAYHGVIEKFMA
jgi:phosphoribosylformylglycinamidine synthase